MFVDNQTRQALVLNGDLAFKFRDERNPNQALLDRINGISRDTSTGIKYLAKHLDGPGASFHKDMFPDQQPMVKELEPVIVSKKVEKFLQAVFLDDISATQEHIETYLHYQLSRLGL